MYTFSLLLLIFKLLFSTSSVITIQTFRFFACPNNHSLPQTLPFLGTFTWECSIIDRFLSMQAKVTETDTLTYME